MNIGRNPHVALTTGTNRWKEGLDLVVEGSAVQVTDEARLRRPSPTSGAASTTGDWDFTVEQGMFSRRRRIGRRVRGGATKVLAFAKGRFAQTRYRFPAYP